MIINLFLSLLVVNFNKNLFDDVLDNHSNFSTTFPDYSGDSGDSGNTDWNNSDYGDDESDLTILDLNKLDRLIDESGLRYFLFRDYSNVSIPVLNNSDNVLLKYGIQIESLEYFDQKGENIKFNMLITQTWVDEFLTWKIFDDDDNFAYNNNPEVISVLSYEVWKPDLELYNAAEEPTIYDETGAMKLFNDGRLLYIRPTKYSFSCKLDLNDFPFDTQTCSMTFGSWKYSKKSLDLRPFNEYDHFPNISINEDFSHNEWNIIDVNVTHTDVEYLCCPGDYYPNSVFTITLKRNPTKYTIVILMTVFITIGDFIVLLLPSDNYRRTFILVFIPLTLIWLQIHIANKIPVIEYSTLMEKILFSCFVINILNAFESGVLFNLIKKLKDKYEVEKKQVKNKDLENKTLINYVFNTYYDKNTKNEIIIKLNKIDNIYRGIMVLFFAIYMGAIIP